MPLFRPVLMVDVNGTAGPDMLDPSSTYGGLRALSYRIFGGDGDDWLYGGQYNDELHGGNNNDWLFGRDGDDRLFGEDGNDTLNGGTGADTMTGGSGNDTYYVDNINDQVIELAGAAEGTDDTVMSWIDFTLGPNVEHLDLNGYAILGRGNELNNTISGNPGSNFLDGGRGNDRLFGWGGLDGLVGGADADTFEFHFGIATQAMIHDFSLADGDVIELNDYDSLGVFSFADLQAHMSGDTAGGTLIDLGVTHIQILNVLPHLLTASDFHIL
jgi:Ca2+-binding RTX toxin-like protein